MKKLSIYHFLIVLMVFSLIIPTGLVNAGTTPTTTGKLTIHKFEQEPGEVDTGVAGDGTASQAAPGTPLEGVKYIVTQTHSFNPETDEWTAVNGTPFEMTTDANGQVSKDLELGRYSVGEISGPDHVNLNPDTFYVDIPMTSTDGTTLNYDVHIYPKNETIRGAVELTKVDGDTKGALAGVIFDLYDAVTDEKVNEEPLSTDANGKIQVDGLAYGNYYFKEVATIDGYMLGSQRVEFSIKSSGFFVGGAHKGVVVVKNISNYVEPEVEKEVDISAVNRGEEVTYTITVNLPADIAEYTNFVVTDVLHDNLEFVSAETAPTGFTFAQTGQTLTWTATPVELSPGDVTFTFTAKVKEDAVANTGIENVATIDYTNEHNYTGEKETEPVIVTPIAGSLQIIKQDGDTEARLAGAEFELRDANGVLVETATTDANGVYAFTKELDYGSYTLHETKAPTGYNKLTRAIEVTINGENSEVTITIDNFKTGWELPKTGGIGTTLFTLLGLTLMGAATFLYFRRRRMA